jgi:putative cell wall-binding protein
MRRACMILVASLLLGLAPSAAQAKRSDFIGTWRSPYNNDEILEIRVNSSYQVYVNKLTYAGILVSYGTTGAPDGHTTATIILRSGAKTTTLVIGIGTLLNNGVDTNKLWITKLVDQSNFNSEGNTHKYLPFVRYVPKPPKLPAPPQEPIAP